MPRTAVCEQCGATFVISKGHEQCQDENVTRTGRCEDYPCCGHQPGECGDRAEFTSEFWSEFIAEDPERFEYLDSIGAFDGGSY